MKLEKLLKHLVVYDQKNPDIDACNLDRIFEILADIGLKEISVNKDEMSLIVRYFVANSSQTEDGAKALLEGRIDKFMGIKLIRI